MTSNHGDGRFEQLISKYPSNFKKSSSRLDMTARPKKPQFLTGGDSGIKCWDRVYDAEYIFGIFDLYDTPEAPGRSGWEWGSGNFYPKPYYPNDMGIRFRVRGPYRMFPLLPDNKIWKIGDPVQSDFVIVTEIFKVVGAISISYGPNKKEIHHKCEMIHNPENYSAGGRSGENEFPQIT